MADWRPENWKSHPIVYAGAFCVCALISEAPVTTAHAQDYAPKGLPLGGFRLFPSLVLGTGYDDNVFLTETDPKSDLYFTETPRLDLKSQWDRHELDLYGTMNAYQYASLTNENHIDGTVGANGRLDMLQGMDFTGGASYAIVTLPNSSPLLVGVATTPTQLGQTTANAAFDYHPYHFGASTGMNFTRLDFGSTQLPTGTVGNADLSENTYNPFLKLSYEFSPGYSAFLRGDYTSAQFDQSVDRNGQRLDSTGESLNAGLDMKVTNLINGQVFAGYLQQNHEAPLPAVSGEDFGANVDWNFSALWTFHLTASRTLSASIIENSSAQDSKSVRLGVDYSILRNVMIQAHASYMDASFPGITRHDEYPEAGIGVTYSMNNYVSTTVSYTYQQRNSNIPDENYSDNRILLSVNLHM